MKLPDDTDRASQNSELTYCLLELYLKFKGYRQTSVPVI